MIPFIFLAQHSDKEILIVVLGWAGIIVALTILGYWLVQIFTDDY